MVKQETEGKIKPEEKHEKRRKFFVVMLVVSSFLLGSLSDDAVRIVFPSSGDVPSPSNKLHLSQIKSYDDKIVILVKNASLVSYANTKSMDPCVDESMTGISISPSSKSDIHIGDIVSFNYKNRVVTHRVFKRGWDEKGWYIMTKGDNVPSQDYVKIRWEQIEGIQIGLLY